MGTLGKTVVLVAAVFLIGGADVLRPRTKAWPLPGVPAYDYQSGATSEKVQALSTVGLLLERPALPGETKAKPRIRYFQLDRASLNVQHCSISKVVFHMEEDGLWKLNLWAEQNAPKKPAS